jgi:hypothetical protein
MANGGDWQKAQKRTVSNGARVHGDFHFTFTFDVKNERGKKNFLCRRFRDSMQGESDRSRAM